MKNKLIFTVFMNHIKFLLLTALAVLAFSVMCCDNGDSPTQALTTQTLNGTSWKLVGIMDAQTGSLTELEPKDCKKCYTLTFGTSTTFSTFSSANRGDGTYEANYITNSFSVTIHLQSEAGELGDGQLWCGLLPTVKSFSLEEDLLKLYYNEKQNYLLFIPYYPIEVPFTEYLLTGSSCRWEPESASGEIFIINSDDELKNYITCTDDNYPDVDFSKNSILLARGGAHQLIASIERQLQQISENEYKLSVVIHLADGFGYESWLIALLTNKLSERDEVELDLTIMWGESVVRTESVRGVSSHEKEY